MACPHLYKLIKYVSMYIIRAENRLLNSLRQRKAEVVNQYGEIIEETENTEHLGIESDLHWQVHFPSFFLSLFLTVNICLPLCTIQKTPNVDCHNSYNFNRLCKWRLKAILILEQLPTSNNYCSKYCTALSLSRTLFFLSKCINFPTV